MLLVILSAINTVLTTIAAILYHSTPHAICAILWAITMILYWINFNNHNNTPKKG